MQSISPPEACYFRSLRHIQDTSKSIHDLCSSPLMETPDIRVRTSEQGLQHTKKKGENKKYVAGCEPQYYIFFWFDCLSEVFPLTIRCILQVGEDARVSNFILPQGWYSKSQSPPLSFLFTIGQICYVFAPFSNGKTLYLHRKNELCSCRGTEAVPH